MFSIIYTLNDDTKDTESIIRSIVSSTFSSKDVKSNVRLNVGVILFNLVFAGLSKCEVLNGKQTRNLPIAIPFLIPNCYLHVYTAILEYAVATNQTSQVSHLFSRVDGWVQEWQLPAAAQRQLLKTFAAVLEADGDKALAVKALIKYIQSYKSEASSYPAELEATVTQAVVNAVNSPVDAFGDRVSLLEVSAHHQQQC